MKAKTTKQIPPTEAGRSMIRHRVVYLTNHPPHKWMQAGRARYSDHEEAKTVARQVNSRSVWVISEHIEVLEVTKV